MVLNQILKPFQSFIITSRELGKAKNFKGHSKNRNNLGAENYKNK